MKPRLALILTDVVDGLLNFEEAKEQIEALIRRECDYAYNEGYNRAWESAE